MMFSQYLKRLFTLFSLFIILTVTCSLSNASSDPFPKLAAPPAVSDLLPSPNHIYYCSPTGSNSTGNGSINSPWLDLIGANNTVGPGDLIYLRGGTYPAYSYVNFSRSQNFLTIDGSATAPIVITNYPGEIAKWNSVDTTFSLTLDGDNQKFIGTKVGTQYGIQITGGISVRTNNVQVSGIEFIGGTSNGGDLNPAMLSVPLRDGCDSLIVSHNLFRDSKHQSSANRMACIRFYTTSNAIVEYNIFKDNHELSDCACVYFKTETYNTEVRHNIFINSEKGVQYFTGDGGSQFSDLRVYGNLFYTVKYSMLFRNLYAPGIRVFNNISLAIPADGAYFYYRNSDYAYNGDDHGEYYNTIIDGKGFAMGDVYGSDNPINLPDIFDFNLWNSASDRNQTDYWPNQGFDTHSVTSADLGLTYTASTMTVVARDNYAGFGRGKNGTNIGGLTWTDGPVSPPQTEEGPAPPRDFK